MTRSRWWALALTLIAGSLVGSCYAMRGEPDEPFAVDTGRQPAQCQVKDISKIGTGTQADWSADNKQIFFAVYIDKISELFRMNVDGTDRRCLTCDTTAIPPELKGKHKGVPSVNPRGGYVLFFAENEHSGHRIINTPGFGVDHDIWAMDVEGKKFWRLTNLPKGSGLQYSKFSFDGTKFTWSQAVKLGNPFSKGREFGEWPLMVGDFVTTPEPKLANITAYEPGGKGYYEAHGTSPDGKKLIFTGIFDPNKSQYLGEIYTYEPTSRQLRRLAWAEKLHFEQAVYAPSGHRISFMSGPFIGIFNLAYKTDLYLMDADGDNRVRFTHFNQPGHPEYLGERALMNKHSWSKDGTKIVGSYYINSREEFTMFMLTFQGACGAI